MLPGFNEAPPARAPQPGELGAPQHPGWAERAKLAAQSTEEIEAQLTELQAKLKEAETTADGSSTEAAVGDGSAPTSADVGAPPGEEQLSQEQLAANLAEARQRINGAAGGEEGVKAAMEALETIRKVMKQNGHSDVR